MQTSGSASFNGNITSGNNPSAWTITAPETRFKPLSKDLETEVLVVGGGIAGITTAYNLLKSGRKVVLVEDGFIGSGETGRTTAHLTLSLGDRYLDFIDMFGEENARLIAESHQAAIRFIGKTAESEKIDCHFKTVDGYLFLHPSDEEETLDKEIEALQKLGVAATLESGTPGLIDGDSERCIRYAEQGQFHPLLFLHGLAEAIVQMGGEIYTRSRADKITPEGAEVNGFQIKAQHIVVTTNTPANYNNTLRLQVKQWPYLTYAIAVSIPQGSIQPALWWDTGDQNSVWRSEPYHYVRTEPYSETHDLLIVGGEDHRTGQEDRDGLTYEERYQNLLDWAKSHFPGVEEVIAQWSGQTLYTIDGIGLIGRNPNTENMYIVTGDCGNGITHGVIGAMMITDLINGKENAWEALYNPNRTVSKKAPGDYLHELGNMMAQYGAWFTRGDQVIVSELKPGEGAVIRSGLRKLAVYRDLENEVHVCTAVCPHLGAILEWNSDEQTFDCPAHGSRFTGKGKVVNGPANADLKAVERDLE